MATLADATPDDHPPEAVPAVERRIVYLMAFRTGLVTLLFAVIVLLAVVAQAPLNLDTPYSQAMFGAVVVAYGCTLLFALTFRHLRRKKELFAALLAVDALLVSVVVHLTGGIQSVWTFLYPLLLVEAAIVGYRRWALWATAGVTSLFLATTLAGYGGLVPPVVGQNIMPDRIQQGELATFLLINLAAQAAIGLLAAFLSDQLRRASVNVAQAHEAIRDMVRLNEQILESLDSGLITLDEEGRILQSNPAAHALLGRPLSPSSQLDLAGALAGLPSPATGELAPQQLRTTLIPLHPGGPPTPLELTITALRTAEGARAGSILLLTDLTEITKMEERMRRAERLAAVGRLAAGIAHEIRNPLAAVSGSLELLKASAETSEDDRRLLQIAFREVERLSTLVTSLLNFARPRPPQPRLINLTELAREVLAVGRQDPAFQGLTIALEAPEVSPMAEVDPDQCRQVLWNLLRNATEAAGKGGQVTVILDHHAGPAGAWVRLRVQDDGPGFPAEAQERLFEPFFSTKEKGTGLGLATVHRIVEDHHGLVEVGSGPGGGTEVTVLLPQPAAARPPPGRGADPAGEGDDPAAPPTPGPGASTPPTSP